MLQAIRGGQTSRSNGSGEDEVRQDVQGHEDFKAVSGAYTLGSQFEPMTRIRLGARAIRIRRTSWVETLHYVTNKQNGCSTVSNDFLPIRPH